jgi:hypothetical protein
MRCISVYIVIGLTAMVAAPAVLGAEAQPTKTATQTDGFTGLYAGTFTFERLSTGPNEPITHPGHGTGEAKVTREADGSYKAVISNPSPGFSLELTGKADGNKVALSGPGFNIAGPWTGTIEGGRMVVSNSRLGTLDLKFTAQLPVENASAAPAAADAPTVKTAAGVTDAVMGDYVGTFAPAGGAAVKAEGKVIAEGGGSYRAVLLIPSAADATRTDRYELTGKGDAKKVPLAGAAGAQDWTGAIEGGKLAAASKAGKAELKFTVKTSPAVGAKPPAGAVVLIPYAEGKPPSLDAWAAPAWKPQADGSVMAAASDIHTNRKFGDIQLHVEFCIPLEAEGRGQGRGNSGIYLEDIYEIQILDSFGLKVGPSECAAVYTQVAPKENACLPPGSWQSYDITFLAPRLDSSGKKVKDASVTVIHNGVKVQDRTTITGPTGSARGKPETATGVLRLQFHEHPVRFRNVWLVELKDDAAAKP